MCRGHGPQSLVACWGLICQFHPAGPGVTPRPYHASAGLAHIKLSSRVGTHPLTLPGRSKAGIQNPRGRNAEHLSRGTPRGFPSPVGAPPEFLRQAQATSAHSSPGVRTTAPPGVAHEGSGRLFQEGHLSLALHSLRPLVQLNPWVLRGSNNTLSGKRRGTHAWCLTPPMTALPVLRVLLLNG